MYVIKDMFTGKYLEKVTSGGWYQRASYCWTVNMNRAYHYSSVGHAKSGITAARNRARSIDVHYYAIVESTYDRTISSAIEGEYHRHPMEELDYSKKWKNIAHPLGIEL